MRFDHSLNRNSIGHLLRTPQDYFRLPPQKKSFRKEIDNIYVHFCRVFVEFIVLLTKIWPANNDFNVPAKCWREGCSERCFAPPPPFTPIRDRCNLSCSFL